MTAKEQGPNRYPKLKKKETRQRRRGTWSRDEHRTSSKACKDGVEQKHQYNVEHSERQECDVVNVVREEDPKSYRQAMRSSQKDRWVMAMS